MLTIWEILDLAESGPYMAERDFDLKVVAKLCRELAKEYDIRFDPEKVIPDDDSLADDLYEAGFRLALEAGLYCLNTKRVIKFTEDQLREGIETAPHELVIGEGKDARLLYARKVEDKRRPTVFGGEAGAPLPEEWFLPSAMSYMKEPLIDAIDHGSLAVVEGRKVKTRSPLEAHATRRELSMLREAARRAGRPGIHLLAAESSITCLGDLSVVSEQYLRPTDAHLVVILNELKTDYDQLTKVVNFAEYGAMNATLPDPIIGGYAGGPEGVAIDLVASFILGRLAYQAHYHLCHPIHYKLVSTTAPECLWVESVVGQAMARNTNMILVGDIWTSAGAGSEMIFYEITANTVAAVVSGMHLLGVVGTNGNYPNASGLEARFMAELGKAVVKSGLKRDEANQIALDMLRLYKERLENPDLGKPFSELYDIATVTPRDWWLDLYRRMKSEVADRTGLPL